LASYFHFGVLHPVARALSRLSTTVQGVYCTYVSAFIGHPQAEHTLYIYIYIYKVVIAQRIRCKSSRPSSGGTYNIYIKKLLLNESVVGAIGHPQAERTMYKEVIAQRIRCGSNNFFIYCVFHLRMADKGRIM
jgi:hypothetical protein